MLRIETVIRYRRCNECGKKMPKGERFLLDQVSRNSSNICVNCILKIVYQFNPKYLSKKEIVRIVSEEV